MSRSTEFLGTEEAKTLGFFHRHSQGLLLGLVILIGGAAVILGMQSIRQSLRSPFAYSPDNENMLAGARGNATEIDTDNDGLTDGDELNFYGTSPYLEDSDSDGIKDGQEIIDGTDPNCPAGKSCSKSIKVVEPDNSLLFGSPIEELSPDLIPTDEELREALEQAGISPEDLNALSADQLLQAYFEAINESEGTSSSSILTPPTLTADEIREALREGGVSEEDLDGVSDEELLRFYEETTQ